MRSYGGTVMLNYSAQLTAEEARLVETPSIALDFLSVVHCLFTGPTLGSSSPVWHPYLKG